MIDLKEMFYLTEKEVAIIDLLAEGLSNNTIANQLMYTQGTVRNCVSSIYAKLLPPDEAEAEPFHARVKVVLIWQSTRGLTIIDRAGPRGIHRLPLS